MTESRHWWLTKAPRIFAIACGVYAVVAGVSALVGWALDVQRLTDWFGHGIAMLPNTAICSACIGAALAIEQSDIPRGWTISCVRALATLATAIAGITLFEHMTSVNTGIDTLLFSRNWGLRDWGQIAVTSPLRMGPPASLAFFLLGIAVVLSTRDSQGRRIASVLAIVTAAVALLSLTGYWYGANQLFGIASYTAISFNTTLVLAALGIGTIASLPNYGFMAALRRDDAGGAAYRYLALPVIVVPLVLGWLRNHGANLELYDESFGTALRSLTEVALFMGLLWWAANRLAWYATAAQKSQAYLAAMVQSADAAIVTKTLEGIIETWNSGAVRTFGYTAQEAVGKHITMLIPPERLSEEDGIISKLKRGERIENYETIRIRKDGTRIHVSLDVSPVRHPDGRIIGASKIARDITEIIQNRNRLRAIIEATPECVKIVAPDGSLAFMNHSGLSMIESDSEREVLGKSVFDLIVPEHRQDWIGMHRRVCAGERLSWRFEIVGLKGTRRWMETHAVPLVLDDGRIAQLGVTREITAQVGYERERTALLENERAARTEAERASRLKDEFLATLSHELRTPLNAIFGWSQLLNVNSKSTDLAEGLDAIRRNASAQAQLIDDLLDMSRIISGKVRIDPQPTNLAVVVEAALESVAPSAVGKGIRITKIFDPHAGPIWGDPIRLQQVVWNLLTNAIKFTPKGGKVTVTSQKINSHLEITVHDTGIGIPQDALPYIFERFRQVDSSTTRSYGGLGLGLSIVKQLVELHGGTIHAASAGKDQGSTFVISLPLAPVKGHEQAVATTDQSADFEIEAIDLTGIRVLVVDDASDARALITRVLVQCGADVVAAATATEGFERVREFQPHVVVSDIGMPDVDGYQFIRNVRTLGPEEGGNVPAIALTAFARSEDRMKAMLAGYQMHLTKPIMSRELVVTVHALSRRA
jgi:PAS domain S-box-containing protein